MMLWLDNVRDKFSNNPSNRRIKPHYTNAFVCANAHVIQWALDVTCWSLSFPQAWMKQVLPAFSWPWQVTVTWRPMASSFPQNHILKPWRWLSLSIFSWSKLTNLQSQKLLNTLKVTNGCTAHSHTSPWKTAFLCVQPPLSNTKLFHIPLIFVRFFFEDRLNMDIMSVLISSKVKSFDSLTADTSVSFSLYSSPFISLPPSSTPLSPSSPSPLFEASVVLQILWQLLAFLGRAAPRCLALLAPQRRQRLQCLLKLRALQGIAQSGVQARLATSTQDIKREHIWTKTLPSDLKCTTSRKVQT